MKHLNVRAARGMMPASPIVMPARPIRLAIVGLLCLGPFLAEGGQSPARGEGDQLPADTGGALAPAHIGRAQAPALAGSGQPPESRVSATDAEVAKASAAAARRPQSDEAWVNLGDAFMQKGRETADTAYYSKAENAYRKALDLNAKSVEAMVGMAWVNGGRHEFEASIDWSRKVLAIDPKNPAAFGLIGDAAVEMGDYDEAFDQYQKMLDIKPDLSSYGRSAHLLQITGDTRRATWLMMKGVAAGSPYAENTAWCRSQVALIYFAEGAYVPAEQVLEEGLKNLPNDYRLLAAMGRVKAAKKDYAAAIQYYRKAIEIAPQQDTVAALGDLYQLTGQTEEMKNQYALVDSIARLNKANGVKGDMLTAKFYADHDMHLEEALKMEEEEYATRKNVYVADTLAWCYFKNGRIEEAKKYIRLALKQKTPEALFRFHQGIIYEKAGDEALAQQSFYEALSLSPNFDPIWAPVAQQRLLEIGAARKTSQAGAVPKKALTAP
jgi:tetratricopeptide (TPR) repeat protein